MGAGKRRELSAEDAALWSQVAAGATPLHPQRRDLPAPKPRPRPVPKAAPAIPHAPSPSGPGPIGGIDRRLADKLRRGRLDPDARIDLHGMTAARAHAALTRFLLTAHQRADRLILVITGKGRAEASAGLIPGEGGVLRRAVPHWLEEPPLRPIVLHIMPAHARHGGNGALYVYLRRVRG